MESTLISLNTKLSNRESVEKVGVVSIHR